MDMPGNRLRGPKTSDPRWGGGGPRCASLTSRYADAAERWIATFECSRCEVMLCLSARHTREKRRKKSPLRSIAYLPSTLGKNSSPSLPSLQHSRSRTQILIRHLEPALAPARAPAPDAVDEFPLPLASAVPRRLQRRRTARTGSMSWQEATKPGEES
eukprot:scaffold2829_cov182-Pinguiococcus_pyrenoidosus.AAC.4